MKWRDLEISEEELVKILKNKCGVFINEFIKNDVPIYRNGDYYNEIRFLKTKTYRSGYGDLLGNEVITKPIKEEFELLVNEYGIASRNKNAVFGIVGDWEAYDGMNTDFQNYLFPVGNYKYSYIADSKAVDFNIDSGWKLFEIITAIKDYFRKIASLMMGIHVDMRELFIEYSDKPFREFLNDKEYIITEYTKYESMPSGLEEIRNLFETIEPLYKNFKNLDKYYNINEIPSHEYFGNEIIFNCSSYIMVNLKIYPNLLEKLKG